MKIKNIRNIFKKKPKIKIPTISKPLSGRSTRTVDKSEYERICNKTLYDAIGSKGCLPASLRDMLEGFDAENNPITTEQAEQIIYSLLQIAVSARANMLDAFIETAKHGDTVNDYKNKINNIHNLISKSEVSNNDMATVNSDYDEFKNSIREENYVRAAK